ncbi:MAG: hypothetical protein ABI851_00790 [Saprospiraceae bacterium]
MMDQKNEQEFDKLFRTKLNQLDLGPQMHLWENIELEIDKNARSSKILGFGWYTRLIVIFTLLSFGIILAYKTSFKSDHKSNQNTGIAADGNTSKNDLFKNELEPIDQTENQLIESPIVSKNNQYNTQVADIQKNKHNNFISLVNPILNKNNSNLNSGKAKSSNFSKISEVNIGSEKNEKTLNNEVVVNESKVESRDLNNSTLELLQKKEIKKLSSLTNSSKTRKRDIRDGCFSRNISRLNQFALDVYYSPEISMRTIVSKDESNILYAQKRAGSEAYNGASSFGFRASYVTPGGLALRTGINFSKIKEKFDYFKGTEKKQVIIFDQNRNPIDTIYSDVEIIEQKYNTYKFLDLPIIVGYEIDLTDFVFSFNGGLGINLSSTYSGQVTGPDLKKLIDISSASQDNVETPYFKKNVGLSLMGSFGLNYKINGRLMLLAEPTIRYYLNPITSNDYPLEQKYLQLGISTGLRYRFY